MRERSIVAGPVVGATEVPEPAWRTAVVGRPTVARQAPVFDLDAPAVVQAGHDGMYALVVPPLRPRDRIRIARRLARGGFADPAWADAFVTSVRARPACAGPTVLRLTVPLTAEPGVQPGHTTVHVGQAMSYGESSRLARALGLLVDAQQRAVSKRRHEWRVRTPALAA